MSRRLTDRPEIAAHDIVTRAMHRTGSDDFGGTGWIEPLEVLTRSLDREARLTSAGRRRARGELVELMVARHAGRTALPAEAPILATGPDPDGLSILESALGVAGAAPLEQTFASIDFELRWHLPLYAEWLSERRPLLIPAAITAPVVAGIDLAERMPTIDRGVIVEIVRDLEAAVAATTHACVAARRRDSDDVDAVKVERYWRWRLGLRAERRAGSAWTPTITVTHDELVEDPAAIVARIRPAPR